MHCIAPLLPITVHCLLPHDRLELTKAVEIDKYHTSGHIVRKVITVLEDFTLKALDFMKCTNMCESKLIFIQIISDRKYV